MRRTRAIVTGLLFVGTVACGRSGPAPTRLCLRAEPIDVDAACDVLYPGMASRAQVVPASPPAWGHRCIGGRLTEPMHPDLDAYCRVRHRGASGWRAFAADLEDPASWACVRTADAC